jgi:F-type H+/Na+-transporting ATPase subunit alpha
MGLESELTDWLGQARRRAGEIESGPRLIHVGRVETIGDGVATVAGLPHTRLDELLRFEDGTLALAMEIDENRVGCVLLGADDAIGAGSRVSGTGAIIRVPVGEALIGRIVDPLGRPLDGGAEVETERRDPIERPAPGIVDRDLVSEPMATGLTVIDAMIPLGRGQRELIVGDRKTGKTAIALDAMINQRDTDVICIYAAIGQKASTVARVVEAVRQHGALDRCIFVVGAADAPAGA